MCKVDGCEKKAHAHGFCMLHYQRMLKHGDPTVVKRVQSYESHKCSVEGCSEKPRRNGVCNKHSIRIKHHGDPNIVKTTAVPYQKRFWKFVDVRGDDECWEWKGCKYQKGYGSFMANEIGEKQAHRVSYIMAHGPIPDGMHIMHLCDNPPCCNPKHLRAGTNTDNNADMISKGRDKSFGKPRRLTPEIVLDIRKSETTQAAYAEKYQVSRAMVYLIQHRKTWKHI